MVELDTVEFMKHEVNWKCLPEMCAKESLKQGLPNFAKMFRRENVDPSANWPHDKK